MNHHFFPKMVWGSGVRKLPAITGSVVRIWPVFTGSGVIIRPVFVQWLHDSAQYLSAISEVQNPLIDISSAQLIPVPGLSLHWPARHKCNTCQAFFNALMPNNFMQIYMKQIIHFKRILNTNANKASIVTLYYFFYRNK